MIDKRLFDDLNERIGEAMRNSPAADLEKNLRAMLLAWFDRLELVTREDFDVQRKLLERAQARLAELEARVGELEAARASDAPPAKPGQSE
ncbi:MAG TPA: accessory factor UbiK family protein [Burkholderiales bacterium]|nr:accessory factor UbiK family protein [Burkholderiales bacterium]